MSSICVRIDVENLYIPVVTTDFLRFALLLTASKSTIGRSIWREYCSIVHAVNHVILVVACCGWKYRTPVANDTAHTFNLSCNRTSVHTVHKLTTRRWSAGDTASRLKLVSEIGCELTDLNTAYVHTVFNDAVSSTCDTCNLSVSTYDVTCIIAVANLTFFEVLTHNTANPARITKHIRVVATIFYQTAIVSNHCTWSSEVLQVAVRSDVHILHYTIGW